MKYHPARRIAARLIASLAMLCFAPAAPAAEVDLPLRLLRSVARHAVAVEDRLAQRTPFFSRIQWWSRFVLTMEGVLATIRGE